MRFQEASEEGDLFAFVPEFYINILPILLDTIMDFSFHDLNVQNDLSGKFADFHLQSKTRFKDRISFSNTTQIVRI